MVSPDLTRAIWRTSSRSGGNGACIEVAEAGPVVAVRDSKDRQGPVLVFGRDEWRAFAEAIRAGRLDLR